MFIGDLFSMLPATLLQFKVTSIAYFCCYAVLVYIAISRVKKINITGFIGAYLVVIFLLNAYFIFSFHGILSNTITDSSELLFTTLQLVAILILGFVAFAGYLNDDGRQSIVFLVMSFCLIFSQVLTFVESYYISHIMFTVINWASYTAALVLFYKYVVEENRLKKHRTITKALILDKKIAA